MRDIYLHGAAGREHGRRWRLNVASPAEAVRALMTLCPALREVFRRGNWRVIVGTPHLRNSIDAACLHMNMGSQPLHIVPATRPRGEDIGDIAVIVVGVILIAVASYFTFGAAGAAAGGLAGSIGGTGISYGTLMLMGIGLVASGVFGLLTPNINSAAGSPTDQAGPGDKPSFYFNGVTNNTQQGGPVPLVFGTHLVGSIVVSGSLNSEQLLVE